MVSWRSITENKMAKGYHLNGSSYGEQEIVSAPPIPLNGTFEDALEIPWEALVYAQRTYPILTIEAQRTWLYLEQGNQSAFAEMRNGYFTLRLRTSKWGPSVMDQMAGIDKHGQPCHPKTHQLTLIRRSNPLIVGGEEPAFLFLIDLRKALMMHDQAQQRRNAKDGTEYLLYDVMDPGIDRCCERLRI